MEIAQIIMAFIFGVAFIVALIVLAIRFPHPTLFQYNVFRIVLALATAGVVAMIPGFINLELNLSTELLIRAGGAIAVFVTVFFFNPAQIAIQHLVDEFSEIKNFREVVIPSQSDLSHEAQKLAASLIKEKKGNIPIVKKQFLPPPKKGDVYIIINKNIENDVDIYIEWGSWKKSESVSLSNYEGTILHLNHFYNDSIPLIIITDGDIIKGPLQDKNPPNEWNNKGYLKLNW